ncbi:MAG: MBL fold metallo-hydrolase [Thermoplasmatota archaeon]
MDVRFLGGAHEVGRVGILAELNGSSLLFDYGMTPGVPPAYPVQAPPVECLFLSHGHLDHSGMAPWLSGRYNVPIFSTPVTQEIARILFSDSLKIARCNGYPFPYSDRDVEEAERNFLSIDPGEHISVGDMEISCHPAGHIPGSLMFKEENTGVLIACDLNTIDSRLVAGAEPVSCDTLLMEGTYAGQNHPPRRELEQQFLDTVDDVVARGGTAIIPAFAVGRTQEVAMLLADSGHEVWLDGMGSRIGEIFLQHPSYLRSPKGLKKALDNVHLVYSRKGKRMAMDGDVIVTTSGMLNGGPVLGYADNIRDDPNSAIIITGYQVEGTNGERLLETGELSLYGVKRPVNAEVFFYDFSAHAGHDELRDFARACRPERVVLFHSDNPEPLAAELRDFAAEVVIPENGDQLSL